MTWNWQQPDWPEFTWSAARLARAEERFLVRGGVVLGAAEHLGEDDRQRLTIDSICSEAMTTSEIEGEFLDRDSVQSSIRRELGLAPDDQRAGPAERGIAEMMVDLYRRSGDPLDHGTLHRWHAMLLNGRRDLHDIGRYRTQGDPMVVASGRREAPIVHFEAPAAAAVPAEMDRFVEWFNATAPDGANPLPALTRAGIAHLYFVCVHPFEDGNGRIARALSERSLAQHLGRPGLTALAAAILARRRSYYEALNASNRSNEITGWLAWFAGITLEAQARTQVQIEFLIDKTKLFDRLRGQLNERQEAVLLWMLKAGPEGFIGGMSAGDAAHVCDASPATVRRDLGDLVEQGALERTGQRKHTRYHLNIPRRPIERVVIDESGEVQVGPQEHT